MRSEIVTAIVTEMVNIVKLLPVLAGLMVWWSSFYTKIDVVFDVDIVYGLLLIVLISAAVVSYYERSFVSTVLPVILLLSLSGTVWLYFLYVQAKTSVLVDLPFVKIYKIYWTQLELESVLSQLLRDLRIVLTTSEFLDIVYMSTNPENLRENVLNYEEGCRFPRHSSRFARLCSFLRDTNNTKVVYSAYLGMSTLTLLLNLLKNFW